MNKFNLMGVAALAVFGVGFTSLSTGAVFAQDAPYYKDKRINIIVTWGPGGTGDTYARVLARHLPNHIAGKPTIIVENMTGGGHNIGANFIYNQAPKDGTTLGIFPSHRVIGALLGEDGVAFEANKFSWLASLSALASTCAAWHEAGVESIADFADMTDPLFFGSKSAGDVANIVGNMAVTDLGYNFKMILGYPDDAEIKLAIETGEIQATCAPWSTLVRTRPEWAEQGLLKPLFVVAPERDPALPDVPAATELPWSPNYLNAVEAYTSRFAVAVPFVAPPGIAEDVVEILRDGVRAMLADPAYLEDIDQVGQVTVRPKVGAEAQAIVDRMYALPASAWDIVVEAQK